MVAKIGILQNILKRQKSMKSENVPLTALQDDVLLADELFLDEVLQLEKHKFIKVSPENTNWYREYSANRGTFFVKLTSLGRDKAR